ncbi:MAG: hypothetical protein ACFFD7_14345 [Candidatus Thorarchaeota archaeon]
MNEMYDTYKIHNKKIYTGMRVGGSHNWIYNNGKWIETKITPDKWNITFDSLKTRLHSAPRNTGASIKTKFHWYIIADQIATKIDDNTYQTSMSGVKFKIGHKRPYWRSFSYQYPEQIPYKERVIQILEETLKELKKR